MAEGGFDLSELKEALPGTQKKTSKVSEPPSEPPIKLLLWNIHGSTSTGMAKARRLLLQQVGKKTDPDIILLQEIETAITVTEFQCSAQRTYAYKYSGRKSEPGIKKSERGIKKSEAGILYDDNLFDFLSEVDLANILKGTTLVDVEVRNLRLRRAARPPDSLYIDRICAIRLRSRESRNDFVVMSFHNINSIDKELYAKGFIELVSLVQKEENVPVVAGADFNVALSVLTTTASDHECIMPDYESSERRISNNKIDLYVIKGTSSESEIEVGVFEALPLVDYNDRLEADSHVLGYDGLKHLTDNAPVKKTREKVTYKEYNDVTNHDPTLCTITSI